MHQLIDFAYSDSVNLAIVCDSNARYYVNTISASALFLCSAKVRFEIFQ